MSIREIIFTGPAGHRARFTGFGVIGAALFWLGLGLQALLTGAWHLGAVTSFLVQGVISVELSFVANRHWTWRRELVPFWRAWRRFNGQKILTILANLALYAVMLRAGVNYLAANVATTALFTVVNYAGAHWWAFRPYGRGGRRGAAEAATPPAEAATIPAATIPAATIPAAPVFGSGQQAVRTVSVVVPCRGNERTIRATVDSLLAQDYPGLTEIILVGSVADTTWRALRDIADPRLIILEQENPSGVRDSNLKRAAGIQRASGDLLALADSDIAMRPDWLSRGLCLLAASGASCVAGGMESAHDTFWGRFVDGTRMAAKTPRVPRTYVVTSENFGRRGRKPPVTANVIITRELYRDCPLDVGWPFGYEDYEWFWRIARAGYRILFSNVLPGRHHHRRGLRPLCREYLRSSDGCARFIRRHPSCPLSRKRLRQAILLPAAATTLAADAAAVAVTGCLIPLLTAGLLAAGLLAAAAAWEYANQRRPEALVYPLLNGILASVFLFGLVRGLVRTTPAGQAVRPTTHTTIRNELLAGVAAEVAR